MTSKKIKCLKDLYAVARNKNNNIISVDEIWRLYNKYNDFHKCGAHQILNEYDNRHRKDHQVLYFLLEKLYMVRCTDLYLISIIIRRIYTEGIKFEYIISDLFHGNKYFSTDEITQMLEYCLKYSYMNKMLFDGFRMAIIHHFFPRLLLSDQYYTSSLSKIMKILLRYGMFLDPITGQAPTLHDIRGFVHGEEEKPYKTEINLWYSIINIGILKRNPQLLPENEMPEKEKEIFHLSIEIANLFMRDALQFRLSAFIVPLKVQYLFFTKSYGRMREIEHAIVEENIVDFVHQLGCFIPELPKRCLEPTPL